MHLAVLWLAIVASIAGIFVAASLHGKQLSQDDLVLLQSDYAQAQLDETANQLAQGVWPLPAPKPFVAPAPSWQVAHPVFSGGIVSVAVILVGSLILFGVRMVQFMRRVEAEHTPGIRIIS